MAGGETCGISGRAAHPRSGEPPSPMRMKGKMKKHFVPHHLLPHPRAMMDRPSLIKMPQRLRVAGSQGAPPLLSDTRKREFDGLAQI